MRHTYICMHACNIMYVCMFSVERARKHVMKYVGVLCMQHKYPTRSGLNYTHMGIYEVWHTIST